MSNITKQDYCRPRLVLAIALWMGTLTGIIEGLLFVLVLHDRHADLIWAAALIDACVMITAALALLLLDRTRFSFRHRWVFVLLVFTIYDWMCVAAFVQVRRIPFSPWLREAAIFAIACGLAWLAATFVGRHLEFAVRLVRRTLPVLVATVLLIAAGTSIWAARNERLALANLPRPPANSPNVILLIIDTLRADHTSPYGYARDTTPTLARMAKQGMLFENALAPSSWTLPSHVSLFTGLLPHEHKAETVDSVLGPGYPTLAEAFARAGYATGAFSANHFFFDRNAGLDRGFIHFDDTRRTIGGYFDRVLVGQKLDSLLIGLNLRHDQLLRQNAEEINAKAIRWLDRNRRPFFLVLNYFDVHDPYIPPPAYRKYCRQKPPAHIAVGFNKFPELSPAELQAEMDAYDDSIGYADRQFGAFVDALRNRGLANDTVIVITSDHGETFGEHGLVTHGNALYLPLIHVPLILWAPGRVPAGRVSTPVNTADVASTLLSFVPSAAASLPGRRLQSFWDGDSRGEEPVISELSQMKFGPRFPAFYGATSSVVTAKWHYIHNDKLGTELYDWQHDPAEMTNLSGNPALAGVLAHFSALTSRAGSSAD